MGEKRVLVVDDDPSIVRALTECLIRHGFDATGTTSTQEALDRLNREPPFVVVSDIMMPCGGAVRILQELAHISDRPAVVVMTGSELEVAEHLVRAGTAAAFLRKPFTMAELLRILNDLANSRLPLASQAGSTGALASPTSGTLRTLPGDLT